MHGDRCFSAICTKLSAAKINHHSYINPILVSTKISVTCIVYVILPKALNEISCIHVCAFFIILYQIHVLYLALEAAL